MSELSEGWTTIKVKESLNLINGYPFKPSQWMKEGLPIIRIQNLNSIHAPFNYCSQSLPEKFKVRTGDLLFAWSGTPGTSFGAHIWKGTDAWLNQHIFRIEFDEYLFDKGFLKYAINQNLNEYIAQAHGGAGLAHITKGKFEDSELILPPRNEQRRIVLKLDNLLGKVEACQQRLEKIPLILKRFRQAVLAAACSGKLTADWRDDNRSNLPASELLEQIRVVRLEKASNNKEREQIRASFSESFLTRNSEVDIPETWVACSIGAIGTVSNGSTPSRKVSSYWGGNINWVSSGEVRNNIILTTRERITKLGYENCSVKLLPPGTVLLAMIGEGKTRGQTAILEITATINQNIAAVVTDHGLLVPAYLWRWFQYQYESTREKGSGSGPQALNCQRVRELPFFLPPLEEQKEIVSRIETLFKVADQLEERYRKAKAHVDKLTQSILAKAFRGELVPTEAELARREGRDYESAAALLERIRRGRAEQPQTPKATRPARKKKDDATRKMFA